MFNKKREKTMKKTYIIPEMEIVKIHAQQLLAGSAMAKETDANIDDENDVLGRNNNFDW